MLLDLEELDMLQRKLRWFGHNRFNLFSLCDHDHGDGSDTPLAVQITELLGQNGISLADGNIHLFCMPRMLGYSFNPLSIYFCNNRDGTPAAVVYQVHNTFGERHFYVIPSAEGDLTRHSCAKTFYVSPFLDMGLRYDFSLDHREGGLTLSIAANDSDDKTVMFAALASKRHVLTDGELLRLLLVLPAMTVKVIAAIHWQALRLWLKGVSLRPKPPAPTGFATVGKSDLPA